MQLLRFKLLSVLLTTAAWCSVSAALELAEVQKKFQASQVDVVYKLQYDARGEATPAIGILCSACNAFHDGNPAELLEDGRDLQLNGYVVAPAQVVIPNIFIEPDMVKELIVQQGGESVKAKVLTVYPEQGAMLLQLDSPLKDCIPLKFSSGEKPKGAFYTYSRICEDGFWRSRLKPFDPDSGQEFVPEGVYRGLPGFSLILDAQGNAVSILGNSNSSNRADEWREVYTKWQGIPWEKLEQDRAHLLRELEKSVFPATVFFKEQNISRRTRLQYGEPIMEISGCAFVLPDGKLVMPLLLTPQQHGLIKNILLHLPSGDVEAKIESIMKNFGLAVLAPQQKIVLPPIAPAAASLSQFAGKMVWSAGVNIYNRKLGFRIYCDVLGKISRGYRNHSFGGALKLNSDMFIFTLDGEKLLGVNIPVRAFDYQRELPLLDSGELTALLNDKQECLSASAMSTPAEETADMGIEYQPMNQELAKSMNLEHFTRNGSEGLLISYVYPGSTAKKIGLKAGDVLLKLLLPNGGKPIRLEGRSYAGDEEVQFPWEELDRIPEMYFSEIPEPWKGVNTPLNSRLNSIGIGQKLQMIAICSGKLTTKEFTIAAAPIHYEVAAASRSESWGWEVRNMTYEVRRYFRMGRSRAGVIVADVFAGSPASTAGLRPFEIITAVNDRSVHNVDEFNAALKGAGEVRLSVRRLATERVITVKPKTGPRL